MDDEILTEAAGSAPGRAYYFDELMVGQKAQYVREVTPADIQIFAQVSGDHNPVHLDDAFAAEHTPFEGRIAHGILSASYISTVLGTILPGPGSIYLNQILKFRAPVRIGDVVETEVEITDLIATRSTVYLSTCCRVVGKAVLDGKATLMAPQRPVPQQA